MPVWLSWLRYCSIVYYAFLNMQMSEFFNGPPIKCSTKTSQFLSCNLNETHYQNESISQTIPYSELSVHLDIMIISGVQQRRPNSCRSISQTIPYSELSVHLDIMNEGSEPLPIWFNTIYSDISENQNK
ncbi:unnamed protein product [Oppiella nova]|uniref:Uncharacterized protein n=1 Tax=Oppiella nova TaxID=334625 RepID=A0A7R9QQ47_9ACAR|nr:unnamed protein product [Oppiella nova]CAG2169703.1 unnamed protein product [Oppiella nova]